MSKYHEEYSMRHKVEFRPDEFAGAGPDAWQIGVVDIDILAFAGGHAQGRE